MGGFGNAGLLQAFNKVVQECLGDLMFSHIIFYLYIRNCVQVKNKLLPLIYLLRLRISCCAFCGLCL